MAVVAAFTYVDGEGSAMPGLGRVQWAVTVPLIGSTSDALEAQQVEYLLHGDLVAKGVEVDARHG